MLAQLHRILHLLERLRRAFGFPFASRQYIPTNRPFHQKGRSEELALKIALLGKLCNGVFTPYGHQNERLRPSGRIRKWVKLWIRNDRKWGQPNQNHNGNTPHASCSLRTPRIPISDLTLFNTSRISVLPARPFTIARFFPAEPPHPISAPASQAHQIYHPRSSWSGFAAMGA